MSRPLPLLAALSFLALPAAALAQTQVLVTIHGSVDYEQVTGLPFGAVQAGNHATLSFELDVNAFVDDPSGQTRGYPIDPTSFTLTLGSVAVGVQFPSPESAYFVLRNDDPTVDGFQLSTSTDLSPPDGVPLDVDGSSGAFRGDFSLSFDAATFSSLDIVDATGGYVLAGTTASHWAIDDGPSTPIGMLFASMTVEILILDPLVRRGDCNGDGNDDIGDAITLLTSLFPTGAGPPYIPCKDSCDANDDGLLDIADAVGLLGALFGSPTVPLPPPTGSCGLDPTPDIVPCSGQPAC